MNARQRIDRETKLETLKMQRAQEIEDLKERHAQKIREKKARADADIARYIREQESAKKLLEDVERQRRLAQEITKDGPEPPTPTR